MTITDLLIALAVLGLLLLVAVGLAYLAYRDRRRSQRTPKWRTNP